jgi:glycosyltransferase involved in cell wall biosynthesis
MRGHVCQVITDLNAGGAEQYVVQLSNYLQFEGRRVSIVAGQPQFLRDRLDADIHIETIQIHPGPAKSALVYVRTLLPAINRLVSYFHREKVTLVHTHLAASALPAWVAARICGIPVIHSKMHALGIVSGHQWLVFASRLHLILVDRFLAFSRYSEIEMEEKWHVPKDRILLSSIGVDTTWFAPNAAVSTAARRDFGLSQSDRVLLTVARLHPLKDVELAIRAARSLDDPNAVLLIAGDGPQRNFLENLSNDLPGRTRIRFLGLLQDLRSTYAAADVLLQTTRGPDLGTTVLEAMASGVPVAIAYRNDEERKMAVNTFDGLDLGAIAEASPGPLGSAVQKLLDDQARLKVLQGAVRAFVERRHARETVYAGMAANYSALERIPPRDDPN